MTIFDCFARTDLSCKKRGDSIFSHMNRSMRSGSEASRELIEDLFSRIPLERQQEMRSRFRSGNNAGLSSVFQELCLHELLARQECWLVPHPSVDGTTKRPDFVVLEPDGVKFLLEAKTSTEVSSGPQTDPRGDRVRDFLAGLKPDGFLIGVDELVAGSRDLPRRVLATHISKSLKSAPREDPDRVVIAPFATDDGWKIRLTAVPDCSRGKTKRGILYEAWSGTTSDKSDALSSALIEKGGRYGNKLQMPFVVAINSFDAMLTDSDFAKALFGENGLWGTAGNLHKRRVSAVLFSVNLWPATLLMGQVETRLYLNPFAYWPYTGLLNRLDTFRLEDGSWKRFPGLRIHQLLDLNLLDSSWWE